MSQALFILFLNRGRFFFDVNLFFSTESAFLKSLLSTKASVSGLTIQLSSVCSRVKVNVNSPIYSTEQSLNVRNNIHDTNCLIPIRSYQTNFVSEKFAYSLICCHCLF